MHNNPSGADRILSRLALLVSPSGDNSGVGDAAEPLAGIRGIAAGLARRNGVERLAPVAVCALLVAAAVISIVPGGTPVSAAPRATPIVRAGAVAPGAQFGNGDGPAAGDYNDLYLGDGSIPNTLQNPALGTDAKALLQTYSVKAGDTLGGIAGKFGIAASTIYWANKAQLPNPSSIRIGQKLLIPPIDGLIIKVGVKTTLASLAKSYNVGVQDIIDTNNLPDQTLLLGQTLLIPGASGGAVPKGKSGSGGSVAVRYSGWLWPVGGNNFISQYFWSGHHAIDIAAPKGTPVYAAVSGTVVFVGNRGFDGGGNVIWVEEGPKLYTTYNHLSGWNVSVGQRVSAGRRIGSVGMTGDATGPHLHFEVWLGFPWALGNVSDAVNPCRYLAGC